MESGTIASWHLKEGDKFSAGDALCAIETDKATMDFEAQDDGVVAKILVQAGPDEIQCGEPILVTVEEDEDISAFADFTPEATSAAPKAAESAPPTPAPAAAAAPPAPTPAAAPSSSPPPPAGNRVVASPLAHMLAKEMGYNIQSISGTGPGGRIIAADVKEYVPGTEAAAAAPAAAQSAGASPAGAPVLAGPPVQGDGFTDFPISEAAKEMGARLAQSKRNVPHYYLTVDITMDNLLKTRASLNKALGGDNPQLGVYEFLLKASAGSMKAVPSANASWMDSVVRVYDSVDINVVVGSGDTLFTPVIRDCGKKGIQGISNELAGVMAYLKEDGEEGESAAAAPPASAMGTFTVLNVGMYGVKSCAPIITEPQACSLAIGALENRIVPNDDEDSDEIYKESVVMTATLSCDHRVVDGAVGAQWLSAFKSYVENPSTLLL